MGFEPMTILLQHQCTTEACSKAGQIQSTQALISKSYLRVIKNAQDIHTQIMYIGMHIKNHLGYSSQYHTQREQET